MNQLRFETTRNEKIEYKYDELGNRKAKIVQDAQDQTKSSTSYQYNPANQLISVDGQSYTFDDNGNLTNDGYRHYIWDTAGPLIQVKMGTLTVDYKYDDQGRRIPNP